MELPTTLKHKPVIVVKDYDNVDGRNAYHSEAKGLTLGLAQWNERGKMEISAKVWRHTGGKWSRQSEELPLHRVIDLALLICKAKEHFAESYRFPKLFDENKPTIDRIGLQGDAMTVEICKENPFIEEDIKLFADVLSKDDEMLSQRLHLLANTLNEMGYGYPTKK